MNKKGRPRLDKDKARKWCYSIHFTKDEYELLKKMAHSNNATMSKLIRASVFNGREKGDSE